MPSPRTKPAWPSPILGRTWKSADGSRKRPPVLEGALEVYAQDPRSPCASAPRVYSFMGAIRHNLGDEEGSLQLHRQAYQGYARCSHRRKPQRAHRAGLHLPASSSSWATPRRRSPSLEANLPLWRGLVGDKPRPGGDPLLPVPRLRRNRPVAKGGPVRGRNDPRAGRQGSDRRPPFWHGSVDLGPRPGRRAALRRSTAPRAGQADELLNHNAVTPAGRKLAADVHALDLEIAQKAAANPAQ